VVCPSLPGYAFSGKPAKPGWGIGRIAAAWAELMARLGYTRYGAQGSDWGTSITTLLARCDPQHLAGIHLAPPLAPPDPATFGDLTEAEQAALCAWIMEKFWAWADHDGDLETVLTRDELLGNLMLYWLPATGASAARLYWESIRQVNQWISGQASDTVDVPTGCSVFPKEAQRPSRRWAARRFTNIRYWSEPAAGGHFAAFEQPGAFVSEVRSFSVLSDDQASADRRAAITRPGRCARHPARAQRPSGPRGSAGLAFRVHQELDGHTVPGAPEQ
jgi:epoxide hydrolase